VSLPTGLHAVLTAFGETPLEAVDHHLDLCPQPAPDPASLEPHEVLVGVRSAAVGWVDLIMSSGLYQHLVRPPFTPGLEFAGEVLAVGSAVTSHAVGDRVIADGFLTGPRSKGTHQRFGGFASYALADEGALIPLPARLSYDEGASLLGSYETAYHCLFTRGRLQAGETVLILGASGATGLAAVHLAKLVGATVIATGRNQSKLAIVASQGADHTLVTDDGQGGVRPFRDEVRALTDGLGVHVVYDGVGGDLSLEALRCVRFGARYLVVGWAGTPFVADSLGQRGAPRANVLPTNLMMMKSLDVLGCPTVISTHHDPSTRPPRLRQLLAWVEEGRLTPFVEARYPLDDLKEALRAKWTSRFVGGCVVHPPG
jgi:NADPH2:quinone reductase